jgi:hypothetical protein
MIEIPIMVVVVALIYGCYCLGYSDGRFDEKYKI